MIYPIANLTIYKYKLSHFSLAFIVVIQYTFLSGSKRLMKMLQGYPELLDIQLEMELFHFEQYWHNNLQNIVRDGLNINEL